MDDINRQSPNSHTHRQRVPQHRVSSIINFTEERKRTVDTSRTIIDSPNRPASEVPQKVHAKTTELVKQVSSFPQPLSPRSHHMNTQAAQKFHTNPLPKMSTRPGSVKRPHNNTLLETVEKPESLSNEGKVTALMRALEVARKQAAKEQRKKNFFKRLTLIMSAVVILTSTGYVGIDTWLTNARLKTGAISPVGEPANPNTEHQTVNDVQFPEGVSKENQPINILDSYKVAGDQPRALYIQKIGVAARILSLGEKDGAVDAPKTTYDAGWYNKSAVPGQNGAVLIDGHSPETGFNYGIFAKLDRLVKGDEISVEMGDGTKHAYRVVATEIVHYEKVDMNKALTPYDGASQGLNIITCHGEWLEDQKTLDRRLIVYTTAI